MELRGFSEQFLLMVAEAETGLRMNSLVEYRPGWMAIFSFSSAVDNQVWSLKQFYSVDFSQSRIDVNKCVFYKHTIKVCVSCSLQCPGTSASCVAHLTVSLYLCSYGSNARVEGP